VIQVCRAANPKLVIRRPRFSALTPADIFRAVGPLLGNPDGNAAAAVALRQEIDLRLGAAFTRWQTLLLQDRFEWVGPGYDFRTGDPDKGPLKGPIISYGPCQFPTLGFIVQRAWERASHVMEPFWVIDMAHDAPDGAGKAQFTWARQRLFDAPFATALYELCCAPPCIAVVTSAQGSRAHKAAPVPLATLALQTKACQKMRCSPERVMAAAESLYQSGFISYPRTETDSFPPDLDLRPLVQEQCNDPRWGGYAAELLANGGQRMRSPRDGGHSDGAHPPIYPTRCPNAQQQGGWNSDQRGVYELVARHFLACVSPDGDGHQTVVTVALGGEEFTTRGLSITDLGFLRIYGKGPPMPGGQQFAYAFDSWGGNAHLPAYVTGTTFVPTRLLLQQRQTQPPGLLTESELLTLMDRHGIGTDATQASHIEKVCGGRGYAQRSDDGSVSPTCLGEALVAAYEHMGMRNMWEPHLRAAMERDCGEVAAGKLAKQVALQRCLDAMRKELDVAMGRSQMLIRIFPLLFQPKGHEGGGGGGGGGGGHGGGGGGGGGPPPGGSGFNSHAPPHQSIMPPPMMMGGGRGAGPRPQRTIHNALHRASGRTDATTAAAGGRGRGGGSSKKTGRDAAGISDKQPAAKKAKTGGSGGGGAGARGGRGGRSGAAQRAPPAGGGRGGGGSSGDVCFRCKQPGHWSSNCPQQK